MDNATRKLISKYLLALDYYDSKVKTKRNICILFYFEYNVIY